MSKTNLGEFIKQQAEKRATAKSVYTAKAKKVPKFLRDKKVAKEDHRVLRRFMMNHIFENIHAATNALASLQRTQHMLGAIAERDNKLAESGLMEDDRAKFKSERQRQDKVRSAINALLRELAGDRQRRIREAVEMEETLEREDRRQRRDEQIKVLAAKKKKPKVAAEVKYEGSDEPGTPTINLDPTLIAEATRGLLADPDKINPKAAAKSTKRNSGTPIGTVTNGKTQGSQRNHQKSRESGRTSSGGTGTTGK